MAERVSVFGFLAKKVFGISAQKIISINKELKVYAKKNNFIYLDYFSAMVDENNGLKVPDYTAANDLVHPNKTGYLVMEQLAQKAIDKALSR